MSEKLIVPDEFRGKTGRMLEAAYRAIHDGTITEEYLLALLRHARQGTALLPPPSRAYKDSLVSLQEQLSILLAISRNNWGGRWLDHIQELTRVVPNHEQTLNDCAVLFVAHPTLEDTLRSYSLAVGRLVDSWGYDVNQQWLYESWLTSEDWPYEQGIWVVHLDLLSGWQPRLKLSAQQAVIADSRVAGPEVWAAIAMQQNLPPLMDGGRRLPHMLAAGLRLPQRQGEVFRTVRFAYRSSDHGPMSSRKPARLHIQPVTVTKRFLGTSAPVVLRRELLVRS